MLLYQVQNLMLMNLSVVIVLYPTTLVASLSLIRAQLHGLLLTTGFAGLTCYAVSWFQTSMYGGIPTQPN